MHIHKCLGQILLLFVTCWYPAAASAQELDPIVLELIAKGIERSHELNTKELEARQAVIDQKLAKSVFLPKVTVNGNYTRLNDDVNFDADTRQLLTGTQKLLIKEAAGMPFNSELPSGIPVQTVPPIQESNILKTAVDLDWVLFSGFQASNALKAGKHKEASLSYAAAALEDKIALEIIKYYDQLGLVLGSVKVLETTESYLQQQELFVSKAIEHGLATPIERKKVALARQQLLARQLEYDQKRTLLIEYLHLLTGEQKEVLASLEPRLKPVELQSMDKVQKRDEVRALEEAEAASRYKAKMERNHFIPKVAVKGHYELLEDDLSLLDPKWYVGVGVQWNLFDGNRSRLEARKSRLEADKYSEQRKEAEDKIAISRIKAQQELESSRQNTRIVEKEIELAKETFEMVSKQYRNDLAAITDVLDAMKDLELAEFKLQDSYFRQRRAWTQLLHAQGVLTY